MIFHYYNSYLFLKFKNHFIISGKKQKIDYVFNNIFIYLKLKYHVSPIIIFYEIIEKIKSPFSLISHSQGPQIHLLPIFSTRLNQYKIALYWFILCIKKSNKYRYRKNKNNSKDFIINNQLIKNLTFEETFLYNFDELYTILFLSSVVNPENKLNNGDKKALPLMVSNRYFKHKVHLLNLAEESSTFLHFRWKIN